MTTFSLIGSTTSGYQLISIIQALYEKHHRWFCYLRAAPPVASSVQQSGYGCDDASDDVSDGGDDNDASIDVSFLSS